MTPTSVKRLLGGRRQHFVRPALACLLFLVSSISPSLFAERELLNGVPRYELFNAETLGINRPVSQVAEGPYGRLLVLSGSEILLFDGSNWVDFSPEQNGADPISLLKVITGPDGTVYGSTERGLHEVVFASGQHYQLKDLEGAGRADGLHSDLREAFVQGSNIYFYGVEQTVRLDTSSSRVELDVLERETKSRFIPWNEAIVEYWVGGRFFVHRPGSPKVEVNTNRGHLAHPETRVMSVWNDRLILGHDTGLSIYEGKSVEQWPTELGQLTTQNVTALVPLSPDYLAVSIRSQGIYVLDTAGRIVQSIDRRVDHRLGYATSFETTGENVLWAGYGRSVYCIRFLGAHSEFSNLLEYAIQFPKSFLHDERLHLVTDGKLVCADFYSGGGLKGFHDLLPHWNKRIEGATPVEEGILFTDFEGIYLLDKGRDVVEVSAVEGVEELAGIGGRGDKVVAAGRENIYILRRFESGWSLAEEERVSSVGRPYFSVSAPDGDVWLENGTSQVTRVFLENDRLSAKVFGREAGFKNAWVNIWTYGRRVMFSAGADSQLLFWDANRKRFSNQLDGMLKKVESIPEVSRPALDRFGNLFVPTSASVHTVIRADGSGEFEEDKDTLASLRSEPIVRVLPDSLGGVWIIGSTLISRYQRALESEAKPLLAPSIDLIETQRNGEVVYRRNGVVSDPDLRLAYRNQNVLISISNPRINAEIPVDHEYRIEDRVPRWTPVSSAGILALGNQHEGVFTVELRAVADGLEPGPVSRIQFEILAPWYRTWYAYFCYFVLAAVALYFLFAVLRRRAEERNEALERLVKERTIRLNEANKELNVLYDKAKAGDEAKSVFLATVSHEMRTPLNAIIGPAQLLQQIGNLPEESRRLVRMIQNSGKQMLSLVEDILEFTSTGHSTSPANESVFNLKDLVEEMVEAASTLGANKKISIKSSYKSDTPENWRGDARAVQQVLGNLLNNAQKFTLDGGKVEVSVEAVREGESETISGAKILVEDNGVGIPKEAHGVVFEPFRQVESSLTRQFDGVGLGLSICRQLVARLDGKIDFQSEEGKGSVFWFTVPMTPMERGSASTPKSKTEDAGGKMEGRRVLLVDDNESNRYYGARVLADMQVDVCIARDGEEALKFAQMESFDLILMDIRMPNLNGIDASKEIRSTDNPNRYTPIVALSAFLSDSIEEECSKVGINLCLTKPISCEKLHEAVSSMIPRAS